jgi:hypothetical protein
LLINSKGPFSNCGIKALGMMKSRREWKSINDAVKEKLDFISLSRVLHFTFFAKGAQHARFESVTRPFSPLRDLVWWNFTEISVCKKKKKITATPWWRQSVQVCR